MTSAVVVSIGNLAVGGTGKTPLCRWAVRTLLGQGATPTVVLRGYGRDEAALHRRWNPEAGVVVDRDRVRGARRAAAGGADVVVLDDGFQHRALARDVDLVLLAVETPFPGRRLPLGPYREGPAALARASGVVITRRSGTEAEARELAARVDALVPGLVAGSVHLAPGAWFNLSGTAVAAPDGDILVVAAVGRPEEVARAVRSSVPGRVELLAFADHHEYGTADCDRIRRVAGSRTVVVTEKDAVKLAAHAERIGPVHVLTETLRWDWGEARMAELLAATVRSAAR